MSKPTDARPQDERAFGRCPFTARARTAWRACAEHQGGAAGKAMWKRLAPEFAGPFDVTIDAINLRIHPTTNYGDRVIAMTGRLPEAGEMALIAPLLRPGGCFVDVGANIGLYAIRASRALGPGGQVLAFEPHPRTRSRLAFNLAANDCANVTVFAHALGEAEETASFFPDTGKNAGRSSMLAEAVGTPGEAIAVSVRRLDTVLDEHGVGAPDLVKVDVEGYEDRVLVPLLRARAADRLPRAILLEDVHAGLWQADLDRHLAEAGYELAARTPTNRLHLRRR